MTENEQEWSVLDEIYSIYEDKYMRLTENLKIDKEEWFASPYYNLYPLQIELSGCKRGKPYKSKPTKLKNVVFYGFSYLELYYIGIYDAFCSISLEYISVKESNRIIYLGYYKKCLDRVYIVNIDNGKPQYSLLLFIDNGIKKYLKATYKFSGSNVAQIEEYGIRKRENQNIAIIDVVYSATYENDCLKEIMAMQNNHKLGVMNNLKIYPR